MEIRVIRAAIQSSSVREPEVGRCSISGMISGVDVPYSISLYGPDYEKKIVGTLGTFSTFGNLGDVLNF